MIDPYIDQFGRSYTELTQDDFDANALVIEEIVISIVEMDWLEEPLSVLDFLDQVEDTIMADPNLPFYLPTDTSHPICKQLVKMARKYKAACQ